MNLQKLSQFTSFQLEEEIQKRKDEHQVEVNQRAKDKKIKEYFERPSCDILGRAYAGDLSDYSLATFSIVGNAGHSYIFKANISSRICTYLSNVIGTWGAEKQLENAMKLLTKSYLAERFNDPEVILDLIGLCSGELLNNLSVREDFEKAVIDRMKAFSDEEILNCGYLKHGGKYLDLVKKSRGITNKIKREVKK